MTKGNASDDPLNEAERDPWFNPYVYPKGRDAHAVIGAVVLAVRPFGRKRALGSRDRDNLSRVLIPLVANLMHHYLIRSPGQGIVVPRSKKVLGRKANRYQPFVFPRSFPKILDALKSLGFAEVTIGKYSGIPGQSKRTTVRAGAKLVALIKQHNVTLEDLGVGSADEIIILKRPRRGHWDEGERVDYKDTDTTRRYRDELQSINAWLASADIRFDATAYDQPVNVEARQLRRIFTLGRFDSGGRLFGGFWQTLSKDVRRRGISIEGETVVGLDYSQVNPLLAYHIAQAVPPSGDAYTLHGLEENRDGVKKIFNAMLFNHPLTKFPKGARALFPKRIKCRDVTDAILLHHPKLRGVLSSHEIGHQLQFLESQIMMGVLRGCLKRNIIALPVFDSVVVKSSAENIVREIMRREFKAVTGLNVTVKTELAQSAKPKAKSAVEIDPSSGL